MSYSSLDVQPVEGVIPVIAPWPEPSPTTAKLSSSTVSVPEGLVTESELIVVVSSTAVSAVAVIPITKAE